MLWWDNSGIKARFHRHGGEGGGFYGLQELNERPAAYPESFSAVWQERPAVAETMETRV